MTGLGLWSTLPPQSILHGSSFNPACLGIIHGISESGSRFVMDIAQQKAQRRRAQTLDCKCAYTVRVFEGKISPILFNRKPEDKRVWIYTTDRQPTRSMKAIPPISSYVQSFSRRIHFHFMPLCHMSQPKPTHFCIYLFTVTFISVPVDWKVSKISLLQEVIPQLNAAIWSGRWNECQGDI